MDSVKRIIYYANDKFEIRKRLIDLPISEFMTEKVAQAESEVTGMVRGVAVCVL